jgi:gentisate 1,2-dioxygenase
MSDEDVGLASVLGRWETRRQRAAKGVILIKGDEQAWELNRQGRCRFYAHLGRTDLANPDWISFRHEIHTHSGVHVHQGGLALFVTKGRGSTVCDGRRADWKADDVILLPVEPGGVEHQHFNVGDEPCEWIAFAFNPWLDAMGNGYEQRQNHPDYRPPEGNDERAGGSPPENRPERFTPRNGGQSAPAFGAGPSLPPRQGAATLYEALLARRDAERARRAEALLVVDGAAQPWEDTPQGRLRWYLHPDLTDRALQTMGLYVQEVPPGSRSGRYRWQGGEMIVFLAGRGVSEVDGERFEWEAGDALCVPVREAGVELCHHNPSGEPARFVCAWPNFPAVLGVDMGAGLEQIESAPEWG